MSIGRSDLDSTPDSGANGRISRVTAAPRFQRREARRAPRTCRDISLCRNSARSEGELAREASAPRTSRRFRTGRGGRRRDGPPDRPVGSAPASDEDTAMSARSRRRARSRILAAFSIALAAAAVAAPGAEAVGGPVLYVDGSSASCTDGGTGTQAAPFCTIGAAAAVVAAGQTVQVAPGVYRESVTVRSSGTSSAPIVFAAAPGATVTGGAHGFAVSGRSWVTINGFDITATSGH